MYWMSFVHLNKTIISKERLGLICLEINLQIWQCFVFYLSCYLSTVQIKMISAACSWIIERFQLKPNM